MNFKWIINLFGRADEPEKKKDELELLREQNDRLRKFITTKSFEDANGYSIDFDFKIIKITNKKETFVLIRELDLFAEKMELDPILEKYNLVSSDPATGGISDFRPINGWTIILLEEKKVIPPGFSYISIDKDLFAPSTSLSWAAVP